MPDDLRDRIADMRLLRDAASPLPWMVIGTSVKCHVVGPVPATKVSQWDDCQYIAAAANLAPALADAYEAALATLAERDAEIARLKEALKPFGNYVYLRGDEMPDDTVMDESFRFSSVAPCPTLGDCRRAADALKGANRDE